MHIKSLLFLTIAAAGTVSASPPACLLGALNGQSNPADVKGICQKASNDVQNAIFSECPSSSQSAAVSAFSSTCQGAGVKIATITPTSSATGSQAKASGTSDLDTTNYGKPTGSPHYSSPVSITSEISITSEMSKQTSTSLSVGTSTNLFNPGSSATTGTGASTNSPSSTQASKPNDAGRISAVTGIAGLVVAGFIAGVAYL